MTFHETAGQGRTLLLLLYAGALCGLGYDFSTLLRRRLPRPLRVLPDLCWCAFAAGLCFVCLLLGREGALRLYALLGLGAGGALYALGLRRLWFLVFGRKKRTDGESLPHQSKEG